MLGDEFSGLYIYLLCAFPYMYYTYILKRKSLRKKCTKIKKGSPDI